MLKRFTFLLSLFIGLNLAGQTILNDSVSIGPGYANQTFYSAANGTISSIDNSDWDLAFNTENREVAIFVNSKKDVKLYLASSDTTKWNSLDTTIKTVKQYHNSDSSWSYGAFNREVPAGGFDYGWGTYSSTTHEVYANKIYFINYGTNLWKKIIISKHDINYTYYFRYANLDGTNEVSATIVKAPYKTKNLIYYSLSSNSILNREPNMDTYDLIFHQYEQEVPFTYKVVGVQQNRNVKAIKVHPVNDVAAATLGTTVLSKNISSIGSDWKTFDVNTSTWSIEDSTVYFVQDITGSKIWKLVFTGYSGASTGKMFFNKTSYVSGINTDAITTLGIYPNPSNSRSIVNFFTAKSQKVNISVKDFSGREILKQEINTENGFNSFELNTGNYTNGTYIVLLQGNEGAVVQKLIINR